MKSITIETAITIEPIDQAPTLLDLASWLSTYFPDAVTQATWPPDPARLPVIEW